MPQVINVRSKGYCASYARHAARRIAGTSLPLPNYKQQDGYSCGFLAALTVIHYFDPTIRPNDVLRITQSSVNGGTGRRAIIEALAEFGVEGTLRKDLTISHLRRYVKQGKPVIISVWPDGWSSDHWCCVQGFDLWRVHLANHPSLSVKQFLKEWTWKENPTRNTASHGIVCEQV